VYQFLLILFLVVASAFSFPKKQVQEEAVIKAEVEKIIAAAETNTHLGIKIVSLHTGKVLYEKNAQKLFVPSSTLKLLTAGAALYYLGPQYQFETAFYADGPVENGILFGNLYLNGSGDPSLTYADLEDLVFQLHALNIHEIQGDLMIDASCFDEIDQGPGWMWDEGADPWNSSLSGLMVQHSCIDLWIHPGRHINASPRVITSPKTSYVKVLNEAETVEKENQLTVERLWMERGNRIKISGKIALDASSKKYRVSLADPTHYTATLAAELLKRHRIVLKGELSQRSVPAEAKRLSSHRSERLSVLLHGVLKESDNLYANALFKKCAEKVHGAPGTWQRGALAIRTFLKKEVGIKVDDAVILDGDGASRYNLISPDQMVIFLQWLYDGCPFAPELLAALPMGGMDGTLSNRSMDMSIRAKSGTMTGLSGLAGFVTTADGEPLAFTIYENGFLKQESPKAQIEDKICAFLSDFSR